MFPGTFLRKLGAKLDDDAVVSVDVGQNQIFTCKYLPQKNGRLLTSGGLGTMGYALPAGIGAKIAAPGPAECGGLRRRILPDGYERAGRHPGGGSGH